MLKARYVIPAAIVVGVIVGFHNSPETNRVQPAYCQGSGTARLPECGWTRDQPAEAATDEFDYVPIRDYAASWRRCTRPVAELSLAELHSCDALMR